MNLQWTPAQDERLLELRGDRTKTYARIAYLLSFRCRPQTTKGQVAGRLSRLEGRHRK